MPRSETRIFDLSMNHMQNRRESNSSPEQQATLVRSGPDREERLQQMELWNATAVDFPRNKCVHHLFEEQVERTPDAVALVFAGEELTYRELNERANQLAHHLIELGIRPEMLVGVCLERSFELVIGILGILKAGGAYMPLDAEDPYQRLESIVTDAKIGYFVTQQRLLPRLPVTNCRVVCLDSDAAILRDRTKSNPPHIVGSDNLAYVMFTSGSTGQPKGVLIQHSSIARLVFGNDYATFGPNKVFLQLAPVTFDASTFELWGSLLHGAKLVIAPPGLPDFQQLEDLLNRHHVTTLWLTAALFNQVVEQYPQALGGVNEILTGGEALSVRHICMAQAQLGPEVQLINGYGPTECTTFAVCYRIPTHMPAEVESIPIGRPIGNTQVYVLDEQGQQVQIGELGELFIGGAGLARGYLNRPELTAEKFVPNPFSKDPESRLYRTGDQCRWRVDGNLEFLGRYDDQIKLRGFRIELGEIESALTQHPSVTNCAVMLREERPGDKRLVAYYVSAGNADIDVSSLSDHLRLRLSEYMVPSAFVHLQAFPLTPNGKIDRRALPTPDHTRPNLRSKYVAPRNSIEEQLTKIWSEVLRVDRIGVHDNFFALGGHSLLVIQVAVRIRDAFQVQISVKNLFDAPTIAALAEHVEAAKRLDSMAIAIPWERIDREKNNRLPLSFAQQRLWFLEQMEVELTAYNLPYAWRLQGPLDTEALHRALGEIVRRHEALRTTFSSFEGEPFQSIQKIDRVELPLKDLQGLAAENQTAEIEKRFRVEADRPFDLANDLMVRASLLRLADHNHVLLLTWHHIASDAWSLEVVFRHELGILYDAFSRGTEAGLPELTMQYADYAVWQRKQLEGERLSGLIQFWREQLKDLAPLELPTDKPRPCKQSYRGKRHDFTLSPDLIHRLKVLGQDEGVTLHMAMLAAFVTVLSRYSGQNDIAVGAPVAGRNHSTLEGMIGFFVNTLVLRTDLSGDPTFRELLGRVRKVSLAAYDHQELPFEKLVEELQPERQVGRSPLVQVVFQVLSFANRGLTLRDLEISAIPQPDERVRFDLEMYVWEASMKEECHKACVIYNTDLFEEGTIKRLVGHFVNLLEGIVTNADQRLSALPMLTEPERHQLQEEWNNTTVDYPHDKCVHQLFEEQVERTPDAVAVVFEGQELTYRKLNERANQLAHHLLELGVGPETLVGLCVDRSLDLIVAILGILKAGGVYLPVDPNDPYQRLEYKLTCAKNGFLVTQMQWRELINVTGTRVICLDTDTAKLCDQSRSNPSLNVSPDSLAYVMFTSGSTGQPKGVMIRHSSIARLVFGNQYANFGSDRVFLQLAPVSFDASTFEIWGSLLHGAKLVIAPPGLLDFQLLEELLKRHRVTTLWLTAALFNQVVEQCPQALSSVEEILTGGEALSVRHIRLAQSQLGSRVQLINGYGPTECTTFATCYRIPAKLDGETEFISIGSPIANTQAYVLDDHGQLVPVGVPGELYLGGVGLARGYLNRPELTVKKFVLNPFSAEPESRLYRTGDKCRWRTDGTLDYLGRFDDQVKLRGFRIELGEIESLLVQHPSVAQCVVMLREDRPGDKRLVAYYSCVENTPIDFTILSSHLRTRLPEYMIPSAFICLQTFPLLPSGKINRRALPVPEESLSDRRNLYVAPRNPLEEQLANIWSEVLGVKRVGMHDNFFDLGGHSLLAIQLFFRIEKAFGRKLPLAVLFQHGTIDHLGTLLEAPVSATEIATVIPLQPGRDGRTLFLLPSITGELMISKILVEELGKRFPIMGIQPSFTIENLEQFKDFRTTARHIVKALRSYQSHGPYALAGFSYGGMLAFEVACMLTEIGEKTDLIAVIDTGPDHLIQNRQLGNQWKRMAGIIGNLPSWLSEEFRQFSIRGIADKIGRKIRRIFRYLVSGGNASLKMDDFLDLSKLPSKNRELLQTTLDAFFNYQPNHYSGKVTLFRANTRRLVGDHSFDLGWGQFADVVEIRRIKGNHETILRPPHVSELTRQLGELLEQLQVS